MQGISWCLSWCQVRFDAGQVLWACPFSVEDQAEAGESGEDEQNWREWAACAFAGLGQVGICGDGYGLSRFARLFFSGAGCAENRVVLSVVLRKGPGLIRVR